MQIKESARNQFSLYEMWCQKILCYIEELGKELHISDFCMKKSKRFVVNLRDYSVRFSGKNLQAIAGAILYIASVRTYERLTYDEICNVGKISQPTLRNRIRDIQKIEFPQ